MDNMALATMAAPQMPSRQVSLHSSHHWGTWEKLLLASAVKRHGTDEWGLVSAELQSRTMQHSSSPPCFTPEACRSEYYTLKDLYSRDECRDNDFPNDMPWLEELRKLRVDQLKMELERYDNSIGSIESRLKRLKSERGNGLQSGGNQFDETEFYSVANAIEAAVESSAPSSDGLTTLRYCQSSGDPFLRDRASGMLSKSSRQARGHTIEDESKGCLNCREGRERERLESAREISPSLEEHCKPMHVLVHAHEMVNTVNSNRDTVVEGNSPDRWAFKSNARQQDLRSLPEGCESTLVGPFAEKHIGGESNCSRGGRNSFRYEVRKGTTKSLRNITASDGDEFWHLSDIQNKLPEHSRLSKDEVSSGRLLSRHDLSSRIAVRTPAHSHDAGAETVTPTKPEDAFALKQEWGCSISQKVGPRKEKMIPGIVCGVLGDENAPDGMEPGSEDSTGNNKREVFAASKITGSRSPSKEKIQLEAASKVNSALKIITDRKKLDRRMLESHCKLREHTRSTHREKSLDFCGNSTELGDSKMKQSNRKHEVARLVRRRKSGKLVTPSTVLNASEEIEATSPETSMEASMKMETVRKSTQGPEGMEEHAGQEADDSEMEAWQQAETKSGDSRNEFIDGNDDVSAISRREKRELKVCGKLSSLLRCFRTISCHKSAPLFKPSQESSLKDDPRYRGLIRAHVDLGMIQARLENGHYFKSIHFFRDLLLMVNNALVYYPRHSQEFRAATALRECTSKEMLHVLKTETLLNQEGSSIKKQDFKMNLNLVKMGQPLAGMQGRRKVLKRSQRQAMVTVSTDVKFRMQSKVANVDSSEEVSSDEKLAVTGIEVLAVGKCDSDLRTVQKSGTDAENCQNEHLKAQWRAGKVDSAVMGVMNPEMEPGLGLATSSSVQKLTDSANLVDRRYPLVSSEATLLKTFILSEPSATVKRGVGRPRKNSQQHVSGDKRVTEAANPQRRGIRP